MNITDVGHLTDDADEGEDKMELGAKREGKTAFEIARFYTKTFKQNLKDLNIIHPDKWVRATDHIKEQIELIIRLEKKGFTYKTSDGIYFDTTKFTNYSKLARLDIKGLKEGARVVKNKEKKNLTDFALWKYTPKGKKRQMEWASPWGMGFPGWHIECSAMSMKYLGETIDIHAGGIDHIPVHHTNEIAQSEAATGKLFSRFWLHGEFLIINKSRMGKSEGNFITLDTVKKKGFDPLAYRYFALSAHYRSKLNFSWKTLESAQTTLHKLRERVQSLGRPSEKQGCSVFENKFLKAVNDDLNMPKAMGYVWKMLHSKNPNSEKLRSILQFDQVLGLDLKKASKHKEEIPYEVTFLLNLRELARKNKDWEVSDRIRKKIEKQGYKIQDSSKGTVIKKK